MSNADTNSTLMHNNSPEIAGLEARVTAALEQRLTQRDELNEYEIAEVSNRNVALFQPGYSLSKDEYEKFSVLCRLSRCGLEQAPSSPSHRAYIGPIIDFSKKLLFRMLDSRYGKKFEAIEEFNMWLVANQASISSQLSSNSPQDRS